jgi:hypothetical protein
VRRQSAALALVVLFAVPAPLIAGPSRPASAQQAQPTITLGPLVDQTLWLGPADAFALRAALTTTAPLAEPSVVVRFGEPVDRDTLLDGLDDGSLGRTVTRTTEAVITDGTLSVALAPPDDTSGVPRLPRLDEGVHPVVVELRDGSTPVADLRSHVVVLPDDPDPAPLGVAVLLERTVLPGLQPDGTVTIRPDDVAWLAATTALLGTPPTTTDTDGSDPSVVSLLVSPELLDGLSAGGDTASAAVVAAFVGAIADHEVLLSPWVPLDEALWIATGEATVIEELRVRAAQALEELLIPSDPSDVAVLDPTAGDDTVTGLVELGIDRFLVRTEAVLAPDDTPPDDTPAAALGPVRLGPARLGAEALLLDASVASRLTDPDPTLAGTTAAAELAALWFEDPEAARGIVLAPDRSWDLSGSAGSALRVLLDEVSASPLLDATAIDPLFDRLPPPDGDRAELIDDPSVPAGDTASRRGALHDRVGSYEAMLGGPQPLSDLLRDLLDAAVADGLGVTTRDAYLDAVELAIERGAQGISIPEGQAFNLTSRSAVLDLRIDNAMGHATNVMVRFASDRRVEFPAGASQQLVLVPGENVLELEVRTRSTGAASVDIRITSPDGAIALADGSVRVRSTALTGVALVLGGGAIIVLLVWWARQIAAARRERRRT